MKIHVIMQREKFVCELIIYIGNTTVSYPAASLNTLFSIFFVSTRDRGSIQNGLNTTNVDYFT